jgi:hypothetical protein
LKGGEDLIAALVGNMPQKCRRASFKKGNPEWDLFGIPQPETLPDVPWKMKNPFRD